MAWVDGGDMRLHVRPRYENEKRAKKKKKILLNEWVDILIESGCTKPHSHIKTLFQERPLPPLSLSQNNCLDL